MVDDDRVAPEAAVGEGICVECGELIPRERLATLADVFRCGECTRSYDAASGPTAAERLGKTA
jgi:RNA polymerase-binding transcription factor DksA